MTNGVAVALTAALAALVLLRAPRRSVENVAALRAALADDPRARVRFYRRAVLSLPLVPALCFFVFATSELRWSEAGATWDATARRLAVPVSIAAVVGAVLAMLAVLPLVERVRPGSLERLHDVSKVLAPTTGRERAWWLLVSLTAGVTEELVFRGLFVLHLHALVPALPVWPLAVAAAVAFGLSHRYQGSAGVVASGVMGLAFGAVAVVTGTVLVAVVLHALWDVVAGYARRD